MKSKEKKIPIVCRVLKMVVYCYMNNYIFSPVHTLNLYLLLWLISYKETVSSDMGKHIILSLRFYQLKKGVNHVFFSLKRNISCSWILTIFVKKPTWSSPAKIRGILLENKFININYRLENMSIKKRSIRDY